ncbi:MAG: threonine/serine dehydratase [Paracoccaceae bacterium]
MNSKPDQLLEAPELADVQDAATALHGIINSTPMLENVEVNKALSGRLLIKSETAQRTGAFKFRGAYNRIRQMNTAELKRGVIAYSSGNHAQAVALAARLLDTHALIVMPSDAPQSKMDRTRELGADIITYERTSQSREDVAEAIQTKRRLIMVPPNEDRRVMAGAGTVALELHQQAKTVGAEINAVLVPCGGGGLTAATAIVLNTLSPRTQVFAVEPETFDDTKRSFEAGHRLPNPAGRKTICDAIMTDQPGKLTFPINLKRLAGVLTVSDADVQKAMLFAFEQFKIVVEPGAAVGLAAVLAGKIEITGKNIAVIATGGNVDPSVFCKALTTASIEK